MKTIKCKINGNPESITIDPDTPLLWTLRDHLALTGTKFGCGAGLCGACTVHLNGHAIRSCSIPVQLADGAEITTIEGLDSTNGIVLQKIWAEKNIPQCGYCQAGMIMAVADLLNRIPSPTDSDIDQNISNICRCGTYPRIRQAIHQAVKELAS